MAAKTGYTAKVGDIIAWESQAAGSWKTKIGKIVQIPKVGADQRTSSAKFEVEILASYVPPIRDGVIETLRSPVAELAFVRHRKPYKIGRPGENQIRTPTEWEKKAVA